MAPPLTEKQEKALHHLYYEEKMYFGRDKIWKLLNESGIPVSRRQVADWLSKQMIHQIFMPTRTPKDVQPTISKGPFKTVGIDLADMTTMADRGYNWILTGIDMFTKKGFAVPLKDKTEKSAAAGLKLLLEQMKRMPSAIRSDNGSEFVSSAFGKVLYGIEQVLSSPGKPQSNGGVERFNGILKRMIKMNYIYTGENGWVDELPQYLDNYNSTYQRVIKMSPNSAEAGSDEEGTNLIKERITKNVIRRHPIDSQRFNVGDRVRVRIVQADNQKKVEPWSRDTYTVKRVLEPHVEWRSWQYTLDGLDGMYYNNDLQLITEVQNEIALPVMFIISKIIRPATQANEKGYIIRWKGYKPADDSFVPRTSLIVDVPKMVLLFEKDHDVNWKTARNGRNSYTWGT
jgi:transposase InsO family protein